MLRHARGKHRWLVIGVAGLAAASVFVARHVVDGGRSPPVIEDVQQARQDWPVIGSRAAADYIGRRAVVCGRVAEVVYLGNLRGEPTFLNVGGAHPEQVFTGVIWGDDRVRFDDADARFTGRRVCMAGVLGEHEETPQIVLRRSKQIEIRAATR